MEHTPCTDSAPRWDRKYNGTKVALCPLHATAPDLLVALESFVYSYDDDTAGDIQIRMEAIVEVARAAIKAAKGDA